jgi:hypothetical protein
MNAHAKLSASLVPLVSLLVATAGCSTQQLYASGQAWQRNECQRIQDFQERKRCSDSSAVSYEEYQKQAAAAKSRQ